MNLGNAGHVDELQSQLLSLLFVINTEHALTTVNIQHAAIQVSDLVMMDTHPWASSVQRVPTTLLSETRNSMSSSWAL